MNMAASEKRTMGSRSESSSGNEDVTALKSALGCGAGEACFSEF